mgnify:CR=1 FL=1
MQQFSVTEVDNYPPPDMFGQFPNWIIDVSGASRFIADGCHIKPQRQDACIQSNTDFSAGYAILADDSEYPCLLRVTEFGAVGLIIYAGTTLVLSRELDNADPSKPLQHRITKQWKICDANQSDSNDVSSLFPIRYCTHLAHTSVRNATSGIITIHGMNSEWEW